MTTGKPEVVPFPEPGIYDRMPASQYHSVRAVSASFLKAFCNKSPAHGKCCLDGMGNTGGEEEEINEALMIGSAAHAATLEPDEYDRMYVVGPDAARNTKAWKEFEAANPGKICLKPNDAELVDGIRSSVWSHTLASKLLSVCDRREVSLFWFDTDSGLPCKARIDMYSTVRGCLVDLKTAISAAPDEFQKSAWRFGYQIGIPWYARALAKYDLSVNAVAVIAVEKIKPYPVVVFEPTPDWFTKGEQQINDALGRLSDLWEQDEWPGYADQAATVPLALPAWAR